MDEAAEERSPPAPGSSPSPPSCGAAPVELPLRPARSDRRRDSSERGAGAHCYEELFCAGRTADTLATLAGALVASPRARGSDVVKQGYLGKLDRSHRRYFVLRAGSHTGPSRLEWYKSQEKFAGTERSASKAALFGPNKQGVIYLRCCLGVSRIGSSRKGHSVALFAKDQTMVLEAEDRWEQDEWYLAVKRLMEEEQKDEEPGEGRNDEDDGYCTLPPAAFFGEVWPVVVKPRGLGGSKSLAGEGRLCLTATSLVLIGGGACSDWPSVAIPLLSVRRFGHLDGSFFLELGRSAPSGPGEIWMDTRDRGNPATAQHIHEAVREKVRALRALPDFGRSPTSNHNQHLTSKRCRPKYRDKPVNIRPLGSRLALPPRDPELQASPAQWRYVEPCKPDEAGPESTPSSAPNLSPLRARWSSTPDTGSYMEMEMERRLPVNKDEESRCGGRTDGWEPGEAVEGLGYMMMSPQVSHSSPALPQDDYVTMASPRKNWPAPSSPSPSLQTSCNSSFTSSDYSPPRPSPHRTFERSQPRWPAASVRQSETDAGQSQGSAGCSTRPQGDAMQEQKPAQQRRLPARTGTTSSPVAAGDGSGPGWASPNSGTGRFSRLKAVSDQSVTLRYRLSLCLPSCLQAEDR